MESSGESSHQHAASLFVWFGGQKSVPKEEERYNYYRELATGRVEWKGNERYGDGSKALDFLISAARQIIDPCQVLQLEFQDQIQHVSIAARLGSRKISSRSN